MLRKTHNDLRHFLGKLLVKRSPRIGATCEALKNQIKPKVREFIDRPATLTAKNHTDFVLAAAYRAAEETLLDHVVVVHAKAYRQFVTRPNRQPKPNKRLIKSIRTSPPWN